MGGEAHSFSGKGDSEYKTIKLHKTNQFDMGFTTSELALKQGRFQLCINILVETNVLKML